MIITLTEIENVLLANGSDLVRTDPALDYQSFMSPKMLAERLWLAIHEMADARHVACPKCERGTLRPIHGTAPMIGCDECKYTETNQPW